MSIVSNHVIAIRVATMRLFEKLSPPPGGGTIEICNVVISGCIKMFEAVKSTYISWEI